MRRILIGICLACVLSEATAAPPRKFPYEAKVIEDGVDGVFVRSGNSREYYPTSKLKSGDKVTVHRHDPGGWYMIAPPPGSFSWIRAEYVRRAGGNLGILTENDVVVRVGSQFGDNHEVEQERLSKGDEVRIIGEKTLRDDGRAIHMLKIQPPHGEYRWINGRAVVPVGLPGQQKTVRDPFAPFNSAQAESTGSEPGQPPRSPFQPIEAPFTPKSKTHETDRPNNQLIERPMVHTGPAAEPTGHAGTSTPQRNSDWARLKQLDAEFRKIIRQDTRTWNLTQLESDYLKLRDRFDNPTMVSEVDRRLNTLSRFKKIKREYDELARLTSDTDRRDAQLLALQSQKSQHEPTRSQTISETEVVAPAPQGSAASPAAADDPSKTTRSRRAVAFDGAGIIQRSAITYAGAPRHVLLAPGGRILAYLQPDPNSPAGRGINLDLYLGRPMGIDGNRSFRPELQTDFILVRSLVPVRLRP